MNFGKLEDGKIKYAPKKLRIDGREIFNPSQNSYYKKGWSKIVDEKPVVKDNEYSVAVKWIQQDEQTIIREYKIIEMTEPAEKPRTFSKFKIVAALIEHGLWDEVKQYITHAGLYDLYLACTVFSEDDSYFKMGLEKLKSQLGIDEPIIEQILNSAKVDE